MFWANRRVAFSPKNITGTRLLPHISTFKLGICFVAQSRGIVAMYVTNDRVLDSCGLTKCLMCLSGVGCRGKKIV